MHHHKSDLDDAVLDVATLEDVTGGVASSSTDPQLASALQSITSEISSLSKSKNNGGGSLEAMLPMMLLMGQGGGSCPCGCGMANCMRR